MYTHYSTVHNIVNIYIYMLGGWQHGTRNHVYMYIRTDLILYIYMRVCVIYMLCCIDLVKHVCRYTMIYIDVHFDQVCLESNF